MTYTVVLDQIIGGNCQSGASQCQRSRCWPPRSYACHESFDRPSAAPSCPDSTPCATHSSLPLPSDTFEPLYTDSPGIQHDGGSLHPDFDCNDFCENLTTWPTLVDASSDKQTSTPVLDQRLERSNDFATAQAEGASSPRSCVQQKFDSGNSCLNSALRILRTLHLPVESCFQITYSKQQSRTIDSLFTAGRTAIQTCRDILSCSCISAPQVHLLLFVIARKLVAWYRSILRSQQGHVAASAVGPTTTSYARITTDDPEGPLACHITATPITVGGYTLDFSLARRVYAQIVLDELAQLETTVEQLMIKVQGLPFYHGNTVKRSHSRYTSSQQRGNELSLQGLHLVMVKRSIEQVREETRAMGLAAN